MAVYLYDEALINKIKNWTQSTNVHVYGPNETARLFETMADENNDEPVRLPLISISRPEGFVITNVNKQPLSFDGLTTEASYDNSIMLNAIPISLTYQIDIYTRYQKEADEFARNLIFNIINFPVVTVRIPYNGSNQEHDSQLYLEGNVADNSDVPERIVPGQFTRYTLNVIIPDAYLWDVRVRDNVHVEDIFLVPQ